MYTVSPTFAATIGENHRAVTKCEVWNGTTYLQDIDLVAGAVTMDGSRVVRSSFNLTIAAEELIPADESSLLFPATAELRPYRGVMIAGQPEYVPLGVFVFEDVEVEEGDDGVVIRIAANDLSAKWARTTSTDTVVVERGTDTHVAVSELVALCAGVDVDDTGASNNGYVTPLAVYQPGTDLWAAAVSMAYASGKQLYVSRTGVPTLADIPDPDMTAPALSYNMDQPGSPVIRFTHTVSTGNTFNGVVASGEGTDLVRPLTATVWNDDPESPYYFDGPYGRKPFFYSSPLLLTLNQCYDAAFAKLKQISGATETMAWDALPNPAIDIYDVLYLQRSRAKVADTFIVDSLTVPLDPTSPMSCSGRNAAVLVGGEE